ncbi:MAG: hypothetical protein Q4A64_00955 [Porphyromonadaceae bacterium]|nr:hypothetical protein [Porphyromonadaceae bacterium]
MLQRLISRRIGYLLVCLLGCVSLQAQSPQMLDPILELSISKPSEPRRVWSFSSSIGANNLFAVRRNREVRRHGWEEVKTFGAELFLSRTNMSLVGNLTREAFDVWDLNYSTSGLELGARYYLRPSSRFSPYMGLSGLWTFRHSGGIGAMSSSSNGINWIQTGDWSRISLSPSAGLDFRVLPFLSITAEYNLRLPFPSSLSFLGTMPVSQRSVQLSSNGFRHGIMFGVKMNFLGDSDLTDDILNVFDWLVHIFGE